MEWIADPEVTDPFLPLLQASRLARRLRKICERRARPLDLEADEILKEAMIRAAAAKTYRVDLGGSLDYRHNAAFRYVAQSVRSVAADQHDYEQVDKRARWSDCYPLNDEIVASRLSTHSTEETFLESKAYVDTDVWAAVSALSARQAEVLRLTAVEQLTHAQAAELLGVSVQTVANQVTSAKRALRHEVIRQEWGTEDIETSHYWVVSSPTSEIGPVVVERLLDSGVLSHSGVQRQCCVCNQPFVHNDLVRLSVHGWAHSTPGEDTPGCALATVTSAEVSTWVAA